MNETELWEIWDSINNPARFISQLAAKLEESWPPITPPQDHDETLFEFSKRLQRQETLNILLTQAQLLITKEQTAA